LGVNVGAAEGREPEAERKVSAQTYAVNLLVDNSFMNKKSTGTSIRVGGLKTVLKVTIGQAAILSIVVKALFREIRTPPAIGMQ
jgi:hypothetical protein